MISESLIDKTNVNGLLELVEGDQHLEHFHIRLTRDIVIIKLDTSFDSQTEEVLGYQPVISLTYIPIPSGGQYLLLPLCVPNDFNEHPEIKKRMEPGYHTLEEFVQMYATPVPEVQPA